MGAIAGKATNDPLNYFAFSKQSAKGTEGTTFTFPRHLDGTGYEVETEVDSIREGGDGQEVGLRYRTMIKGDGQLVVNHRQSVAARLWDAILGSDSIATAGMASVARHTAVPVASLKYFTMEQRQSDLLERQVDAQFTSLTVEGEAGKPWRLTAAFMTGGTLTFRDSAGSSMTATREVGKPAFFPGGSYQFDGAASYAADVTKWKVEVNRNVDDGIQTTALNRDDLIALNFDVNIDATLKYTSKEFYQKVQYNSGSVIPANLATGSLNLTQYVQHGTLGASCLSNITVPLVEWFDGKVNKLDPDGKTVYLDVVGGSVKNATYAIWAINDNTDIAAY